MDAPSPTPERSRELADLRQRAYGPDADIQSDPDAVRRLSELEELVRDPVPPEHPVAAEPAPPEQSVSPDGDASAHTIDEEMPAAAVGDPGAADHSNTARPGRWRRVPLWTVGAICLVAGIVIGVGALLLWPKPASTDAAPDLTLGLASQTVERAPGFTQNLDYWGVQHGSVVAYDSFGSIGVWAARGQEESRCVMLSAQGQIFAAACAAKGLDPVFDFTVHDNLPVTYDGRPLPEGSVVRFIARTGGIDVWVRPSTTLSDFGR
jgi:hypothetical protein